MRIPGPDGRPHSQEYSSDDQTALRMVWLVFAGWWLALGWTVIGWLCVLIAPLAPRGLRMLAGISRIICLRSPGMECTYILHTAFKQMEQPQEQRPVIIRMLYATAIGWWVSLAWAMVALVDSLSIERRPSAIAKFMRLPRLATLHRY